jgi:3-phenylpropionate/trans-cinnamate dioxygenase ferredoxin reductase subunit
MVAGHAHGKPVLVARQADEVFAIGAHCTHYAGPLADGLMVDDTVRCPWHHACFSLRTGEALAAPALSPVARWSVEQHDGMCYVTDEIDPQAPAVGGVPEATARHGAISPPASVVIVGAGAAGNAAAEMLRREGYVEPLTLIGGEDTVPYDRPNLSKDYLAGTARLGSRSPPRRQGRRCANDLTPGRLTRLRLHETENNYVEYDGQ